MTTSLRMLTKRRMENTQITETADPQQIMRAVRDKLVSSNMEERAEFVEDLELRLLREKISLRCYLIPLGIPGRTPGDLTPTEVGHLFRFLTINIPQAHAVLQQMYLRYSISLNSSQFDH